MCVLLFDVFNGCSLEKKCIRLKSKGMSNIYYWEKLMFSKLIRRENAFLTLSVNCHKIVQKNKLCHPKQK